MAIKEQLNGLEQRATGFHPRSNKLIKKQRSQPDRSITKVGDGCWGHIFRIPYRAPPNRRTTAQRIAPIRGVWCRVEFLRPQRSYSKTKPNHLAPKMMLRNGNPRPGSNGFVSRESARDFWERFFFLLSLFYSTQEKDLTVCQQPW